MVTVTLCDTCGDPSRAAVTYRLVAEGHTVAQSDRCSEHKQALVSAFQVSGGKTLPPINPPRRRGGPTPRRVVTLDEIEALKRPQSD